MLAITESPIGLRPSQDVADGLQCASASQFAQLGRLTEHAIHVWENVCFTRERLAPPCKIFINRGKGAKDRYILFPTSFRLVLKSHLHATPRNRYLFETRRFGPFTTRRIQQIVQGYREMAGITQPLHPHLFRHQMLTFLTSKGLSDAQIQLISGHESKKSLEVYQHLSLESVDKAY
jgi:site-specific recombinase XerD